MDTAIALAYMSPEEIQLSLTTANAEQAFERALRQSDRICEEEKLRTFRVQLLLLEDENDTLQEQLAENDDQIEKLEDGREELRQRLTETESDLQRVRAELRSRLRDIENYKAELHVLNATTSDATKILTEKLALARELATLKPEVEHLRSQVSTQQNLLGEKLALQRELSALQVELETEKRTIQRIKAQEKQSEESGSTLMSQIEELKKELAKERRDAQKNEREARKRAAEWESQKDILESKLEAFRTKLRTTKEQLKEAQQEVEEAQVAKFARSAELMAARVTGANPKKRTVTRFDPDITIGTPGHGRPAAKKARTSALPGDKSTFSITPFLNRTMSVAPDSPAMEQTDENINVNVDEVINKHIDTLQAEVERGSPVSAREKAASKKTAKPKVKIAPIPQPLKESTNAKANGVVPKKRLAKVIEEGEEAENVAESTENLSELPAVIPPPAKEKKKQKLLGQRNSIFDEDEDSNSGTSKTKGPALGRGMGLRGGGSSGSFGRINLVAKGKALAEFSPLKKDRKAAQES